MSVRFCFECDYCGMRRNYKSIRQAKIAAQAHGRYHKEDCMNAYVQVYKVTFNPYKKTMIAEYEY